MQVNGATSSPASPPERELDVVVIGAGIGGLGSALAFARAGHHVTLVERDDTPMPADIEGAFEWDRRGAPQVRHPHAFLGLARTILRDRFPDVLAALTAAGVHTVVMNGSALNITGDDARPPIEDDDLQLLACRRTTFEWVLRRCVLAEHNVTLRVGTGVAGLVVASDAATGPVPTVTGVRMEDGSIIDADLVVASTGRRGDLPSWLAEHGVEIPETTIDAGVVYYSRFYRSDEENYFGFRGGLSAGLTAGVIGADAGTYSITAVIDKNDTELRKHLSDSDRFDATMRLMPELADVVDFGGKPILPVHLMTGLINRIRRFTDAEGTPRVRGLLAVGDAHTCTNPAYGRGQSMALLQATLAVDAVADAGDLLDAGRRYEAASAAKVEPWYHFSVMSDQMRPHLAGSSPTKADSGAPEDDGTVVTESDRRQRGTFGGIDIFGLLATGMLEPELLHQVFRVMNMLEPPSTLVQLLPQLQEAAVRAEETWAERRNDRPRRKRVTRDEMLAVVA